MFIGHNRILWYGIVFNSYGNNISRYNHTEFKVNRRHLKNDIWQFSYLGLTKQGQVSNLQTSLKRLGGLRYESVNRVCLKFYRHSHLNHWLSNLVPESQNVRKLPMSMEKIIYSTIFTSIVEKIQLNTVILMFQITTFKFWFKKKKIFPN